MSLRIRRGTDAQRTSITFDLGELVWTTDSQKLYVGDGITAGGINAIATMAGTGFTFNPTTQRIDFSVPNLNLNTSEVAENSAYLYFTDERAQDAVAAALLAGNPYNTGISFSYDDVDNRISAVATGNQIPDTTGATGKYLTFDGTNVVWHNPPIPGGLSIPSFGGNQGKYLTTDGTNLAWANIAVNTLTYNTYNVVLDSSGNLTTSGNVKLPYGKDILRDNGSGTFVSITGGLVSVSADSSPSLGGNLGLNGRNISGIGNINITGNLQASGTLQAGASTLNSLTVTTSLGAGATTVTTLNATTGLGANLPLNNYNINGTGNIDIAGSINAGTITGSSLVSGNLTMATNTISSLSGTIYVKNATQAIAQLQGISADGSLGATPQFNLFSSRGTLVSPQNNQAGDNVLTINFGGYYAGSYQTISSIISQYDPTANLSSQYPKSNLAFVTNNGTSTPNIAYFDKNGVFNAPVFLASSYTDTTMNAITNPTAGMIIFNTTHNHFYGYNGSNWVGFTGP